MRMVFHETYAISLSPTMYTLLVRNLDSPPKHDFVARL